MTICPEKLFSLPVILIGCINKWTEKKYIFDTIKFQEGKHISTAG